MKRIIFLTILCLCSFGCSEPQGPTEAEAAATAAALRAPPKEIVRPPFPNMANAFWGKQVLKELKPIAKKTKGHLALWLKTWHENLDGKIEILKQEAWAYYHEADKPEQKNTALSLLAVSFCLDWSSENYKDQLVDAVGLVHLAGESDKETLLGQVARAFVFAKAGLVHRGETLISILRTQKSSTEDVLLMKAMTLDVLGTFNNEYVQFLENTIDKKPTSLRAKWMKAKLLNRWGAYKEASATLQQLKDPNIFVRLTQAESLMGQGKWLAAKALLALSEDARASLTQVNLGKLRYLEAKTALQLKEYGSYKAHLSQLGLSPLFAAERNSLKALAKKNRGINSLTVDDLPKPNRLPAHLRLEMVSLWLEWSAATGTKKYFKDASKKALAIGLDPAFVYRTEAQLKKKLASQRNEPKEKSALLKESRYLQSEAKKCWPQGLGAQKGHWLIAARRALLDGANTWAARKLERMGRVWKKDPVMQALMARAQPDQNQAWQQALKVLPLEQRLSSYDIKNLLKLAPQNLPKEDRQALQKLSQTAKHPYIVNFIGTQLSPQHAGHDHGKGH